MVTGALINIGTSPYSFALTLSPPPLSLCSDFLFRPVISFVASRRLNFM